MVKTESERTLIERLTIGTCIGIVVTFFLALIALASGGAWSMLIMLSLIVLSTVLYGAIFRRSTWLHLHKNRMVSWIGVGITLLVFFGSTSAYAATNSTVPSVSPNVSSTTSPTHKPVITSKLIVQTVPIPFQSTNVSSDSLAQGTSTITTAGVNGVETKTFLVTYRDGVETKRSLKSDVTTTEPTNQVTTVGTYVAPVTPAAPAAPPAQAAPSCTNGSYVNKAGNTVCDPETSSSAPAGSTARCYDGTYSFSQSRRGTCSSHGGVAEWL